MLVAVTTRNYNARNYNVRVATLDDAKDVARLYVSLQRHHVRLQPGNPRYHVAGTKWSELARAAIEDPKADVFVVEDAAEAGTTIGMMKLVYADKPWGVSCEVDTMIVDSRHRNHGIGTIMLEAAEERAKQKGAAGLRVDVLLENYDGRRFYERAGYEAIAVRYGKRI
jgi:ribosomal protein S18 acetylase RimI-like enzyme